MSDIVFPPRSFEDIVQWLPRLAGPFTLAELALAAAILLLAFAGPGLGSRRYDRIEQRFSALARHPTRQIIAVGLLAVVARAVALPWVGQPEPLVHDEQSIFLQAQTFMAGRLANPVHPFWEHFEAFYVNQVPAYASMYFPGRGAPLALGLLVADNAWVGVWMSVVFMCMAATWMLQGWVSLPMALLGGVLVTLRLGVFSYWINSYFGGAFAASGAMLVVGALPRILREPQWRHGALMGLGAAILMTSRPYEGALLCLPVAVMVLVRLARPRWRSGRLAFAKVAVPVIALVGAGGALMLAYDSATTGDPLKTPYSVHRETYASAPAFLFSSPVASEKRGPAYFRNYFSKEAEVYDRARGSAMQLFRSVLAKLFHTWNFYIGPIFTIALVAGLSSARREWFLPATLSIFLFGYVLETWNFPQYTAPIYPVLLILMMRGFERLRPWQVAGRPVGLFLTRAMPTAAVMVLALPTGLLFSGEVSHSHRALQEACCAYDSRNVRYEVARKLAASPGRDLVLLKDGPQNPMFVDMAYNDPDIDRSEVVWAHRLGPEKDLKLQRHFAGRRVWEFEWLPDTNPGYRLVELRPPAPAATD